MNAKEETLVVGFVYLLFCCLAAINVFVCVRVYRKVYILIYKLYNDAYLHTYIHRTRDTGQTS